MHKSDPNEGWIPIKPGCEMPKAGQRIQVTVDKSLKDLDVWNAYGGVNQTIVATPNETPPSQFVPYLLRVVTFGWVEEKFCIISIPGWYRLTAWRPAPEPYKEIK